MFLKFCKDALNITIAIFIILLLLSISLLLVGVGAWLYHISIILGIISTPILGYLIILVLGTPAYLNDIVKEIKQRKENRKSLKKYYEKRRNKNG